MIAPLMGASSLNLVLLLLLFLVLMLSSPLLVQKPSAYASKECINYDPSNNTIVISCGNANLTDVYNAISANNSDILNKGPAKVWTLNANIKIENNTNFYINSSDTSWLKINSTFAGAVGNEPNHILARGNLIIDSVKITSWDTNKNDYARANGTIPRSYILVNYGNGTTNITNSELAYLGYPHARSFGLTYYTGAGSIIKSNKIHDLQTGFYSDGFAHGAHNITIEGNDFYNNTLQGIGPHSGSHHLTISNNTVHNNGREGIICSIDCYNIIIESNKVSNNTHDGIVLRDNVTKSTITNNIVHNNKENQIWLDKLANNNSVYTNNINGGINGIRVSDGTVNNRIINNTIRDWSLSGIHNEGNKSDNYFAHNKLASAIIASNVTDKRNEANLRDPNLKTETVYSGLDWPTSMAFLGPDDILVLEKNSGKVKRIINGVMLEKPLLNVNVAISDESEIGMLGVTVAHRKQPDGQGKNVFLYFTEASTNNTNDVGEAKSNLGNRLYRYDLVDNKLVNPELLLDLPFSNTGNHNGGSIVIGPDSNIYLVVGDVGKLGSKTQNYQNGSEPDGTSGILRLTQDGNPVGNAILGDYYPLNLYYAYGIKNSFGIDFDPITGKLWDTENGPVYGDEINLVEPGFNSGWVKVQGMWEPDYTNETSHGFVSSGRVTSHPENLVDFGGKGKYSPPEFTWETTVGPTAIKFFNSDKLGSEYQDDVFVGAVHSEYLYHFDLNENRNQLLLEGALTDRIANNPMELAEGGIVFGEGLGGITDIEVGPDGYLYLLFVWKGEIVKILPDTN